MHHALRMQEILSEIFSYFCPPRMWKPNPDLPLLARTCRAFKEPALNALWEELGQASPLARCLPEVCYVSSREYEDLEYSFSRPLSQTEWAILRSYTRRIRVIWYFRELEWDSVRAFLNPPTTDPLFPNLRHISCYYLAEPMRLLHLPLPSLVSLNLMDRFDDNDTLRNPLESFPEIAPNVTKFSISVLKPDVTFNDLVSSYICRWRNLQDARCPGITLNMDALVHLSRTSALTRLSFVLSATVPHQIAASNSPLVFSDLRDLNLHSKFLRPISRLLSLTQLPSITDLACRFEKRPSKLELSSFFAGIGNTIQNVRLVQWDHSDDVPEGTKPLFDSQDLQPCTSFSDLRRLHVDIDWDVRLTHGKLRELAEAWPHLECLIVNYEGIDGEGYKQGVPSIFGFGSD